MELLIGVIVGLVVLIILVAVHELGHAVVARRNGVVVKEFAIGFPPRAVVKKPKTSFLGKNVEYSFNWLPLGGYVRMQGEYDSSHKKGDYGAAGYWAKTKILFAGVAVNWVTAAILLTILAWIGMPKIVDGQFTIPIDTRTTIEQSAKVRIMAAQPNSLAQKAGLQAGDTVRQINGTPIVAAQQVTKIVQQQRGKDVEIAIERDGARQTKRIQVTEDKLGISIGEQQAREVRRSTWSAPLVGIGTTIQFTGLTFTGLGDMVVKLTTGLVEKFSPNQAVRDVANQKINEVGQGVTGPIGILGVIFPQAGKAGLTAVLFLAALVSLSLAVMNTLPIPALDGGRWAVMTLYRIRNKTLTQEREEQIQMIGMMTLFALMILVTVADIGKVL